ncbi:PadR family transcriptional regulator [Calderihabitans maritimus]|uniref:PadR family transcriptional regulator n=1 Tax=Calderihabitans maritimus TaxID=1246530 RepID=A0A1Z5HQU1_9FIRM|nr:PadR family transcriptional regulator [Calderihabitans maritimus]
MKMYVTRNRVYWVGKVRDLRHTLKQIALQYQDLTQFIRAHLH